MPLNKCNTFYSVSAKTKGQSTAYPNFYHSTDVCDHKNATNIYIVINICRVMSKKSKKSVPVNKP